MSNTALNNVVTCSTRIKPESSSGSCFASRSSSLVRLPHRRLTPLRIQSVHTFSSEPSDSSTFTSSSEPSDLSTFTSTVGSPRQIPTSNLSQRHVLVLNVLACSVAISATWLFFSAIPTLLAFKKAAESMGKLLDVTREELPGTMAAVRLSGMEISDLTMELSDLGQQITQGVRGSTRAVRLAEERLRQFTNTAPSGGKHSGEADSKADGS